MISPAEFIPIAEETGLINQIGEWVLRPACAEAMNWPGNTNLAVNVSPVQFKAGNLVQTVINALAASGLASPRLELEITEFVSFATTRQCSRSCISYGSLAFGLRWTTLVLGTLR